MKTQIKVSVIVPVYNREKYLHQCVDSIVAQTLEEIEIILVDDGSTDSSPSICDEYAAKDSRVKVIHKKNEGMGVAYNTGMAEAKGEYIGFVETDDWIEPEMYEDLYAKAIKENVDVVKSLYSNINGEERRLINQYGNRIFNRRLENLPITAPEIAYAHPSTWSAIYRRSFIERYKIQYPERPGASAQDRDFHWRVITQMRSFYLVPMGYYNYRIGASDSSGNQGYKTEIISMMGFCNTLKWLLQNNISSRFMELFYKNAFNVAKFNNTQRCKGIYKIRQAKDIARIFAPYISNMQFTRFSQQHKEEFLCMLKHPVWYGLRQLIYKNESRPAYAFVKFLGLTLYEHRKIAQCDTKKLLYLPIRKEIFDKQGSTISYIGLPLTRTEKQGNVIRKRFLGIQYKTEQVPVNPAPHAQDVHMLKFVCYANAIAEAHKQTFPKYKNSLRGKDVMIVACGPTANYAPILPDIKHLAINRAITMEKYHFDFCFMIDYPAVKEFISTTFDYGCVNFFGKYVYDPCRGFSIPDSIAELAHAERFYSEVPFAMQAYHDIEHFPLADFGTTVHPALSFLFYTRPRKIYLVGCDTANTGYFKKSLFQKPFNPDMLKSGYIKLKEIRNIYYPEIEIISINPVGLKGMFKDVYTKSYLKEHPEIKVQEKDVISDAQE